MTTPIGNVPKRIINPKHNQPARVGEWKMPAKSSARNIFIQNNYYGDAGYRNWGENAWAQYDKCDHSGGSKFGEILGYIGLGLGGLSSIIGLFKKDTSG